MSCDRGISVGPAWVVANTHPHKEPAAINNLLRQGFEAYCPMVRKRWWPLLLSYPLAMTFTLVYTAEHWVIDVLVGWAYVGLVFLVVGYAERWWAARRSDRLG